MSRLEQPLVGKLVRVTGDVLLRAELDLLVCDNAQNWHQITFRVDSGSEITTMPAARAKALNLPHPRSPVAGLALTTPSGQIAQEVRPGFLKVQVVGMDGTQHWFPCYFLGDPDAPASATPAALMPRNLLGITGVIDKLRITLEGTPTPSAPYGVLLVETT